MIVIASRTSRQTRSPATERRGAALFTIVMATALIVSVLALATLNVMRIERRSAMRGHDAADARRYAQAAIEIGLQRIKGDPNWRTTFSSGVWELDRPIGDGTYTLEGIDPNDGILATPDSDSVVLIGTGRKGSTTQKFQVTLVKDTRGLSSLQVAMQAGNNLSFGNTIVQSDWPISANNSVDGSGTINANVEAVVAITGTASYNGTTTTGITPRALPDVNTVFDYYVTNGTSILISDLPVTGQHREFAHKLLSPANNPFGDGATNAQGIYVIDCLGANIRIYGSRIVGTLVLKNVGSSSVISSPMNWKPAVANYPALLVQGNIELYTETSALSESSFYGSFNPPGTPYLGVEDTDVDDSFPAEIKGLVYVSGALTIPWSTVINGVLIAGGDINVNASAESTFTYDAEFINNPPLGFRVGDMRVSPGSWRKNVD